MHDICDTCMCVCMLNLSPFSSLALVLIEEISSSGYKQTHVIFVTSTRDIRPMCVCVCMRNVCVSQPVTFIHLFSALIRGTYVWRCDKCMWERCVCAYKHECMNDLHLSNHLPKDGLIIQVRLWKGLWSARRGRGVSICVSEETNTQTLWICKGIDATQYLGTPCTKHCGCCW